MIGELKKTEPKILAIGNHTQILQATLDFDFYSEKTEPSLIGIVTASQKTQKLFWGKEEIHIPCFASIQDAKEQLDQSPNLMLNLSSARGAYTSTIEMFEIFPDALGGHIFCEEFPEQHAIDLIDRFKDKTLIGASGVGLLIPGLVKLGAIGGITPAQISNNQIDQTGQVAVIVRSGGLTNECITLLHQCNVQPSFVICLGGEQYPLTSAAEAFSLALRDPDTDSIVYITELGGTDDAALLELLDKHKLNKPVHAYVSGHIGNHNLVDVQFGHAGALLEHQDQSAAAKTKALSKRGVTTYTTFTELASGITSLPRTLLKPKQYSDISKRTTSLFSSPNFGQYTDPEADYITNVLCCLLERSTVSSTTREFTEAVFNQLIDHGANVSGAVNTMVTARAGKDLPTSLASGLLTIGDRFGGAINGAAKTWFEAVENDLDAATIVQHSAQARQPILGIGHKLYRTDNPDPRVKSLSRFTEKLKLKHHYTLAREVESLTTQKKANLILNVDGVVAALLLDLLIEIEGLSRHEVKTLIDSDFFNAFFIIPRSIGFISHFLHQKRIDEGLFRLPDDLLDQSS